MGNVSPVEIWNQTASSVHTVAIHPSLTILQILCVLIATQLRDSSSTPATTACLAQSPTVPHVWDTLLVWLAMQATEWLFQVLVRPVQSLAAKPALTWLSVLSAVPDTIKLEDCASLVPLAAHAVGTRCRGMPMETVRLFVATVSSFFLTRVAMMGMLITGTVVRVLVKSRLFLPAPDSPVFATSLQLSMQY